MYAGTVNAIQFKVSYNYRISINESLDDNHRQLVTRVADEQQLFLWNPRMNVLISSYPQGPQLLTFQHTEHTSHLHKFGILDLILPLLNLQKSNHKREHMIQNHHNTMV
jgi:hypothetical protein